MITLGSSSLKLRAIFWLYFPHSKKYSWRTLAQELPERSEAEALPRWLVGSCSGVYMGQSRGGTFLGVILWGRGDQTLHHRIIMLKQQEVIKPAAAASSHSLSPCPPARWWRQEALSFSAFYASALSLAEWLSWGWTLCPDRLARLQGAEQGSIIHSFIQETLSTYQVFNLI